MTDVEANNAGTKRKSFSNKQGKKDSPKKFKPENTKTPQKGKIFDKSATPKQQNKPLQALGKNATPKAQKKSPNKQNSPQKPNLKNNQNSNSDSSKKLKPFAGTSEIQSGKDKKIKNENKAEGEEKGLKKRRNLFVELTSKVKSGDKEVIKTLENKIQAIQGRGELSKTAKKKLKMLVKLKNAAEGKQPAAPAQKALDGRSTSTKRRDRKKKAIIAKETSETKSGGAKINGKGNQKGKPVNKQLAKKAKLEAKQEDSEDESEEDESDEAEEQSDAEEDDDESGTEAVEGESGDEEEGEDSDEVEGEEDSDESDDEEESEESPPQDEESDSSEEATVPMKKKREKAENGTRGNLAKAIPKKNVKPEKTENDTKNVKTVNLDELKKNNLVSKNQKRFVLFVGNIPYETNKLDLIDHFKKCGEIKHIRIPTEKKSSKPRGFAYVEVGNEETYQKCLSMHHSFLKERRINVLYTQGGKKKGEEKKKEIKAKNFKLHAMRKQGKLAGSKKEVQKRSFRRAKQRAAIRSEQDMNNTE